MTDIAFILLGACGSFIITTVHVWLNYRQHQKQTPTPDPEPLLVNTSHPDDGNTWHQPPTAHNPYPYRLDMYGPDHDGPIRHRVDAYGITMAEADARLRRTLATPPAIIGDHGPEYILTRNEMRTRWEDQQIRKRIAAACDPSTNPDNADIDW